MADDARAHTDWQALKAGLTLPRDAFIDGRRQPAASGERFADVNPATEEVLADVASCGAQDVDRAVAGARAAFEDGRWRHLHPAERGRRLMRLAEIVESRKEVFALVESLDTGKPVSDALAIDMAAVVRCLHWYGEAADKLMDEIAPTDPSALALVTREPVGVVAAVVPWNFPLLMAAWKIGPALAAGNSVVLKPAEESPLTALMLAEAAIEAGIPAGVLQVVPGFGETAGRALGLHPDVDMVAFTGSTEVGKLFLQYAGQSNMKRVSLECGGKSPHIVMADCPDLDAAAEAAAGAIFFNQGEVCTAGSRLLLDERIHDDFMDRLLKAARRWRVGDPLDPATRIGPLVSARQKERVEGYIAAGREEAGEPVFTGALPPANRGFFVPPMIFDRVAADARIAREEIFGPVLAVMTFRDEEEAVRIANDTIYGLAGAVWSRDINRAHRMARAIRAGTVWVNCWDPTGDMTIPFGGFKQSGFGRDKSLHALEKYTDFKTTWIALS
ncbi:MAG: aldehyde dehydrogenase [Rhodothalassiaceae bacterium]|nr:MAG: aldehyde dehydrogenase [Rhodothalassiaceae bacterium]